MRILSLSDFYPPVIGGMERHVQSLSHELVRRGHHVAVAALEREGSPRYEVEEGVHVHRIGGLNRLLKPFYKSPERPFHPTIPDPGVMIALRRVINIERPDVIHGRGWIVYSALPLVRSGGPAMIVTLHDYGLVCAKRTFMHKGQICSGPAYGKCVACAKETMGWAKSLSVVSGMRLSSSLYANVDRYIAVSRAVADASAVPREVKGRVKVIPSFVPDAIVNVARRAPRPAFVPQGDYMLFVGGLDAHKGLDVLLDAYGRLSNPTPLVVIATRLAESPPPLPSGVTLVAGVEHDAVMGAWAHSMLGLVPSSWPEPFGQVAVEAMACGKAVVASDIGGLADIVVDGETGRLVPPREPIALSVAIDELVSDPTRRDAMGAAGRVRAPRFFASTVAVEVEALYEDVLAERALVTLGSRTDA